MCGFQQFWGSFQQFFPGGSALQDRDAAGGAGDEEQPAGPGSGPGCCWDLPWRQELSGAVLSKNGPERLKDREIKKSLSGCGVCCHQSTAQALIGISNSARWWGRNVDILQVNTFLQIIPINLPVKRWVFSCYCCKSEIQHNL